MHIAEGTPEIWMKASGIQEVFFNLICNALDALEESEKKEIHIEVHPEGEFVQVTITDSGRGIAGEDIPKIFEPFFTTKDKSIGLGLSIVARIIEQHGGTISVQSKPGHGSKFNIRLPMGA